ncbi:hypothetical protein NHF48_010890 [Sphingomonas sp. H160509]|uniref:hypothetical protein n=1 Tax=Sphingomonas sp. H160509 TaxID=2955313 RepID=UPI002096E371|nr:hypothetical protein [Sphingomonas sp. H160509]MDD1451360.1 hypothetical protein [Sphingomonas sp. H160509]
MRAEDRTQFFHGMIMMDETCSADLSEREMHRRHDRCPRERPRLKIGEVERFQRAIARPRINAASVAPERFPLQPTRLGQRRRQAEQRDFPP